MHWVAPSEKDAASVTLEKRLWDAADQFRANSGLKAQEYSAGSPPGPFLGLIFLRMYEYLTGELAMIAGQRDWLKFDLPYPKSDFRSVRHSSLAPGGMVATVMLHGARAHLLGGVPVAEVTDKRALRRPRIQA